MFNSEDQIKIPLSLRKHSAFPILMNALFPIEERSLGKKQNTI